MARVSTGNIFSSINEKGELIDHRSWTNKRARDRPTAVVAMMLGGFNGGMIAQQLFPGDIDRQQEFAVAFSLAYVEGYISVLAAGWLKFGPHDKNGGLSVSFGGTNSRLDFGKLPNHGKAANRMPSWIRGKKAPHWHRRGAGGIGRHRPWQQTPSVPWWKFWERF